MVFPYKKILIIASNHVGNNVFCTPGIRFLKKHIPDIILDVVTLNQRSVEVFVGNPDIRNIKVMRHPRKMQRLAANYDYVIALHPDKAKKYLENLPIPYTIIPHWSGHKHRSDDVLEFIQKLINRNIEESDRCYHLHYLPKHSAEIAKFLPETNNKNILVGMHLGIGRTAVHGWKFWYPKRAIDPRLWPLENYIELAKQLSSLNSDIKFVITGSPNEKFLGKKFLKRIPNTINLIGKTSLPQLTALMDRLQLFITPDTGALHVAASTQVPLIGLFGPSMPELTGPYPYGAQKSIIKKNSSVAEIMPEEVCQLAWQKIATVNS